MSIELTAQKTHRVRLPVHGKREDIGICRTREEAEELQNATRAELSGDIGITLDKRGETWLDARITEP